MITVTTACRTPTSHADCGIWFTKPSGILPVAVISAPILVPVWLHIYRAQMHSFSAVPVFDLIVCEVDKRRWHYLLYGRIRGDRDRCSHRREVREIQIPFPYRSHGHFRRSREWWSGGSGNECRGGGGRFHRVRQTVPRCVIPLWIDRPPRRAYILSLNGTCGVKRSCGQHKCIRSVVREGAP
jgi:hypothetical protein